MKPHIIYESGYPLHGELLVHYTKAKRSIARHFVKGIGSGLIAISIMGLVAIYGPVLQQEILYETGHSTLETINYVDIAEANDIEAIQKESQEYGVNSHFSVVIPKIGASADILANIDTSDPQKYNQALMKGIAHAKGTYFPGQDNNVYLFAHSTNSSLHVARYNAEFYLLNKLEEGDQIIVYFSDERYIYTVTGSHIIDPDDTSWLQQSDTERLTLQTCYPPGTTLQRLIVTAKPAQS